MIVFTYKPHQEHVDKFNVLFDECVFSTGNSVSPKQFFPITLLDDTNDIINSEFNKIWIISCQLPEWEVTRRTSSKALLCEACPLTALPHRRPAKGDSEKIPPCREYRRLQPSVPHHLITLRPAPSHRVVRLQSGFPLDAYVGLVREICLTT